VQLVFGHDADIAQWAASNLGIEISPPFVAIGVADAAGLRGGIVYNNYNRHDIEMSIYGPGCMYRGVIRAALSYPFDQLGVLRVTAQTRRGNKLMRALLPRLGFELEGVKRRHFGPNRRDDAFVYGLLREQNKWR
jgi:RimJ/RimL family protein N-acetyltransferase